ncbi:alpha-glucosidase [Bifidobacterium sp. DSM 109957]|uniref:Alpha-glucosidase n=2 Tax=Bifidobacterium oedipodis TaxID=2675322 RepID=A0A7Y0ESI4_9BIFI|nr:alpha-glucosidase [Bifidobacterium sp. DSM 109957]
MMRDWKKETTVYQVYPKSFYDANSDGIGDIAGITAKLDYLAWLGVTTIWISPFFKSPMVDNGYDISDYYSVDPMFGSNEDLDELIAEAKSRGMRVLFDLVVNHCSDQHEWFRKACTDPNAPERDYFVIRRKDQLTNWRSVFGGSVWSPLPGSDDEYYMHVFAKEQPDLNWENPALRHEIYKMMNHWLDKGIGGFRVDAITYIKKNQDFPDFPADGPDGLAAVERGSCNQPGIEKFLSEMRRETFDRYDCMTVAEATDVPFSQLPMYSGTDGFFSMIFEFSYQDPYVDKTKPEWYRPKQWSVEEYKNLIFTAQEQQQKLGVWSPTHLECHDSPRALTRLMRNADVSGASDDPAVRRMQATMLATMFFFLRGTPFIYQGQELGVRNTTMSSIDQFDDIFTHDQYQVALRAGVDEREAFDAVAFRSRDNARTPMPWSDASNAGFFTDVDGEHTSWLPVNNDYRTVNVSAERTDEHSTLSFYRAMVALRSTSSYRDVAIYGDCVPVYRDVRNVIAYDRHLIVDACGSTDAAFLDDGRIRDEQTIRVICNFQETPCEIALDESMRDAQVLLANSGRRNVDDGGVLRLEPFEAMVIALR